MAGRCRRVDGLPGLWLDGGAEVGAFEAAGDDDEALQVFAADLVLRRKLLDGGERAERGGVAGGAVEDSVLDGVERGAMFVAEADADGVGAAVGDERIVGGEAVEDGRWRLRRLRSG